METRVTDLEKNQHIEIQILEEKVSSVLTDMHVLTEENSLLFNEKRHLESLNLTLNGGIDKYRIKYKEKKIECKRHKQNILKLNDLVKHLETDKKSLVEKMNCDVLAMKKKEGKLQT